MSIDHINAARRAGKDDADTVRAPASPPKALGGTSPGGHFMQASVHHAIRAALALGPGTYGATHRHKHSTS